MREQASKEIRRVGVVLDQAYHFHRQVFPGILAYQKRHPHLHFSSWNGNPILAIEHLERVEVDGIVAQLNSEDQLARMQRLRRPFVNVSNLLPKGGPRVVSDDVAVGRMAAEHLWESGLRHFAFCGIKGHR
jgi:LacI family transcriptional regulator